MSVNDFTFGVEIETTIPRGTIAVGPHGFGYSIPQLAGWKADRDPSIQAGGDREACEFVSPVYRGIEGLKQLVRDVETIKGLGAAVNRSCGCHIHVGFNKADAEAMKKLTTLVANFEKAIYASTGTKSRETGRWCNGLRRYGNAQVAQRHGERDRYHVLNIATGGKPTVEFRAFGATLNTVKIVSYVRLVVGIVERALLAKRTTNWTPKKPVETSPIHRSGEGQTELARLFYQLGWVKGRVSYVHGDLTADELPDLKATKKELMRLAKKYDANSPVEQ